MAHRAEPHPWSSKHDAERTQTFMPKDFKDRITSIGTKKTMNNFVNVIPRVSQRFSLFVGQVMLLFAASGHLVFKRTSPLSRGLLKSYCGGKTSIQTNAKPATAEGYYYASSFPSIRPVLTEPSRIGARNLLCESKLIVDKARGHLLRKWILNLSSQVASEDVFSYSV